MLNKVLIGIVILLIILTALALTYDYRRHSVKAFLSLTANDIKEGEKAKVFVDLKVDRKYRRLNCLVNLNDKRVKKIVEPGDHTIVLERLQPGKYEVKAECVIEKVRYGKITLLNSTNFEVKAVTPEIKAEMQPLVCYEGDKVRAKVKLTNVSEYIAIFDDFTLKPKESRAIELDAETSRAGDIEKTYKITYQNELGKKFEHNIKLKYRVKQVEPVIKAEVEPFECFEKENVKAKIKLRNISEHEAIFDGFSLKPEESRIIELDIDTSDPGKIEKTHKIIYENKLGKKFEKEVKIKYRVIPIEPVIKAEVKPLECYEGDKTSIEVKLTNISEHEAVFKDFILKPRKSQVIEVSAGTSRPGENTIIYPLEYQNTLGRKFTKDVEIKYLVKPLPAPSISFAGELLEGRDGIIQIEVSNTSSAVFENLYAYVKTPEDLYVEDKKLELKKLNPGERRGVSLSAKANYNGDYSLTVIAEYEFNGKRLKKELPAAVTVGSTLSSAKSIPAKQKVAAAAYPLAKSTASQSATSSVIPQLSVAQGSKCQVCLTEFSSAEPGAVRCPHCNNLFHYRCIVKWINKHRACPVCKMELNA